MTAATVRLRDPAATRRLDRYVARVVLAIAWVAAASGFGPKVYAHAAGTTPWPPPILYVHAAVMVAWLGVFSAQATLVAAGRPDLHRRLGLYGMGLAVAVAVLGLAAALTMSRIEARQGLPGALPFLYQELVDVAVFSVLVGLAYLRRRAPDDHRRLMMLSLIYALTPAFARWLGRYTDAVLGGSSYFGLIAHLFLWPDLLMLAVAGYELVTRGSVHRIYRIAIPVLIANEFLVSAVYHSTFWPPVARLILFGG